MNTYYCLKWNAAPPKFLLCKNQWTVDKIYIRFIILKDFLKKKKINEKLTTDYL